MEHFKIPELPNLQIPAFNIPEVKQVISSELLSRGLARASKKHWSVLPSFWLLVVSVIFTLAGATASLLSLPQVQKLVFSTAENQSVEPHSVKNQQAEKPIEPLIKSLPIEPQKK